MTLIVWRWPILAAQVVRVYRSIRKRNLIIVGVVVRSRQRVRSPKLIPVRKAPFETHYEPVIVCPDTRLEVLHDIRSAHDGIERHGANHATDNEMRTDVANVIRAQ